MNTKDRVISFGALIRHICRKWPLMLLLAVLLAVCAGGYRGMKVLPKVQTKQAAEASGSSAEGEAGEEAAVSRLTQADLAAEQDVIRKNLLSKNLYLQNSLKVRIDPYHEGRATMTISVHTAEMADSAVAESEVTEAVSEEESADGEDSSVVVVESAAFQRANCILREYRNFVLCGIDWGTLPEEMGTEEVCLSELLSVESESESAVSLTLAAIHPDREGAQRLMEYVRDALPRFTPTVRSRYGAHTLQIGELSSCVKTDKSLFTFMKDRVQEINDLSTQRDNLTKNLNNFDAVEKVSAKGISRRSAYKSMLKYGLLGFAAGLVLFVVLYAGWLIASGKVLSGREFTAQYQLTKLAAVPGEGSGRADRANYYSSPEAATAWQVAHETIRSLMKADAAAGPEVVGIVGDLTPGKLEIYRKYLEEAAENSGSESTVEYRIIPNLNADPSAPSALAGCDAVVLAADPDASTYTETNEIVALLKAYHKDVIGSITVG